MCRHFNRKPWNTFDLALDMPRSALSQDKFDSELWNRLGKGGLSQAFNMVKAHSEMCMRQLQEERERQRF